MHSIVREFMKQTDFALRVKLYLDILCEIKEENFSAEYISGAYFFTFKHEGVSVDFSVEFKDIYGYVVRKGIDNVTYKDDIDEYIQNILQRELANKI